VLEHAAKVTDWPHGHHVFHADFVYLPENKLKSYWNNIHIYIHSDSYTELHRLKTFWPLDHEYLCSQYTELKLSEPKSKSVKKKFNFHPGCKW
jgi:hypothetical protein